MRYLFRISLLLVVVALIGCEQQQPQDRTDSSTTSNGVQDWILGEELDVGMLYCVAALAPDKVWAVGESRIRSYEPRRAKVVHWDGTTWREVATLGTGDEYFSLTSITALSDTDIWAVGTILGRDQNLQPNGALIAHWNGTTWKIMPGPNLGAGRSSLSAVAGIASDDVWAVGSLGKNPLLLHWNGESWEQDADLNSIEDGGLKAITAVTERNIWAVGWTGKESLIVHYDGATWKRIPSPSYGTNSENKLWTYLKGIVAVAENDVWAVGFATDHWPGGRLPAEIPIIMHWDGVSWSMEDPEPEKRTTFYGYGGGILYGVAALAPDNVWTVGVRHNLVPTALRWNGQGWNAIGCPSDKVDIQQPGLKYTSISLFGVAKVSPDQLWAVGSFFTEYGPTHRQTGYVLRLTDRPCPTPTPIPTLPPPPTPISDLIPTPIQTHYPQPVPSGYVPPPVPSTVPR